MNDLRLIEISKSEIELIKCNSSSDYADWLKNHGNEADNPFVRTAQEKYDDAFFCEHRTLRGYNKYLNKFPNGAHIFEAKDEIDNLKENREARTINIRQAIEVFGFIINIAIFLFAFLTPQIAEDWNIGESFLFAGSLTPLYYFIYSITKRSDKD